MSRGRDTSKLVDGEVGRRSMKKLKLHSTHGWVGDTNGGRRRWAARKCGDDGQPAKVTLTRSSGNVRGETVHLQLRLTRVLALAWVAMSNKDHGLARTLGRTGGDRTKVASQNEKKGV
jgi:hypothetical protein